MLFIALAIFFLFSSPVRGFFSGRAKKFSFICIIFKNLRIFAFQLVTNKFTIMKKIFICLMALSLVAFFACKKDNEDPEPTPTDTTAQGGDTPIGDHTMGEFLGSWDLYADIIGANLHTSLMGMGETDTTMNFSGLPMPVIIEQTSANTVSVSGNFDMMGSNMNFSTTGTVATNGLTLQDVPMTGSFDMPVPAEVFENLPEGMGGLISMFMNPDSTITLYYTGTLSFQNPTDWPDEGSIIINAALNLEGQDAGMYGQHLVTFTLTAPHVEAIGSRASKSRKR